MTRLWVFVTLCALAPAPLPAQPVATPQPSRSEILAAGRDVMHKARYCTLITLGDHGHPQARIVDPLAPDADFIAFVATNPLTRKVKEIQRDPRVTLSCFDSASSSYATLLATATIVTDAAERLRRWKAEWSPFYPGGAKGNAYTLIRLTPVRLEVVSVSRGLEGDAKTWRPLTVDFPLK
jgi:general stress protein 26